MLTHNLILAAILATHPALWAPRYHISTAVLVSTCCAWLATRIRSSQLQEVLTFAVVASATMVQLWASDCWILTPRRLWDLLNLPYPEREMTASLGSPVSTKAGVAREAMVGPGDVIVVGDSRFLGLLWNNDYSNRVEMAVDEPLEVAVKRTHAKGVVCEGFRCLPFWQPAVWESHGPISMNGSETLYLRAP